MKIQTITYKCDICGKEASEEVANSTFHSASYTTIKYNWEGYETLERDRYEDVCVDCIERISEALNKAIKEIQKEIGEK